MVKITAIRGFKDVLPEETPKWQFMEYTARSILANYGFREIRIPVMEKTELFTRGIGETTDIVEKEMYTFIDRGEESLSLRPEATASILRAVLEHNLHAVNPVLKLYTIGPMFRRERPQKGRLRQFHQIDAEVLGSEEPYVDAEVIALLMHLLHALGVNHVALEINSLGCAACRSKFREAIRIFLDAYVHSLCPDCIRRSKNNPLRVFDCKVETCRESLMNAPVITDYLCGDCQSHFLRVQEYLSLLSLSFVVNSRMVRGLDYYTRTAFEVTTDLLGAQNAVAGGGRYDGLSEDLGGPRIPGIGFAIGCERILALIKEEHTHNGPYLDIFIAALGEEAQKFALPFSQLLRRKHIKVETGPGGKSLKWLLKQADRTGTPYVLIVGENELNAGSLILRNMKNGEQRLISTSQLEEAIMKILRSEQN
ncbi:MAG: histidine--tRNA ligase [Syntrophales bacterium]|nr:histidine--tRNA ligase [Syntrophales bacterium]